MPRVLLAVSLVTALHAPARETLAPVARESVSDAFSVRPADVSGYRQRVGVDAVAPTDSADRASVAADAVGEATLCSWLDVNVERVLACATAEDMSVAVETALASADGARLRCLTERILATRDSARILLYLDSVMRAVEAGRGTAVLADVVAAVDDADIARLVSDIMSLFVAEGVSAGRLVVSNGSVSAVSGSLPVGVGAQAVQSAAQWRRVDVDVVELLLSSGAFASRLGVIRRLMKARRERGEDVSDLRDLVLQVSGVSE